VEEERKEREMESMRRRIREGPHTFFASVIDLPHYGEKYGGIIFTPSSY